jgi:hypothetical protein
VLGLLATERDPDRLDPVPRSGVQHERAPAAPDVEESLPRPEPKLPANDLELPLLGTLEALDTVTRVLERADRPMRACEIHLAACQLYGGPLRWPSVKDALSAYTRGGDRRFRRLERGVYELAHVRSSSNHT